MQFDQFSVLLLKTGARDDFTDDELNALQDGHLAHLASLHEAGVLLGAGPAIGGDDSELRGFGIFHTSPDETRRLMSDDPSVSAGRFRIEIVQWMVPAGAMAFAPTRFPHSIAEAQSA